MEDDTVDPLGNWEPTSANNVISLAILGTTGNDKSATGNSILGRQAFTSNYNPKRVTSTSELKSAILEEGRAVNVIDTPGFFDWSNDSKLMHREIVKCIDLAKDGLHAVLIVFSIDGRIKRDEGDAIERIKTLFGDKIVDYMIVVFTNGDILEARFQTLENFISICPDSLKDFIHSRKNRVVVFDNSTNDKKKKEAQVKKLISLVDSVVASNGGKPFSSEIFDIVKEGASYRQQLEKTSEVNKEYPTKKPSDYKAEMDKSYEYDYKRITEKVRSQFESQIENLKKELAESQATMEEKDVAYMLKEKELKEELQKLRKRAKSMCVIL